MFSTRLFPSLASVLLFPCLSALMACGNAPNTVLYPPAAESTRCVAGMAQLAIRDGSIQNLCGCAESAGQILEAGVNTSLVCTVPVNTVVLFHYVATENNHMIMSVGTPMFVSSPISDASDDSPFAVHAAQFAQAGRYSFQDAYSSGIKGTIVVQ